MKESKGIGAFFKSALFVEEKETTNIPEKKESVEVSNKTENSTLANTAAPVYSAPVSVKVVYPSSGAVIADVLAKLELNMDERNLEGPDYCEYRKALKAIRTYIHDDSAYKLAFDTLRATSPNLNKKYVLESIDAYVGFSEEERGLANSEFDETYKTEITDREIKIVELSEKIESNKKLISDLSSEIVSLTQEITEITNQKSEKQLELDIDKKSLDATFDAFINDLNNDKLKIEQLINE